jgi:hypothetical protein
VAIALDPALFQMADADERAGSQRRRQGGREDETRRVAAQKIDERPRARDIANLKAVFNRSEYRLLGFSRRGGLLILKG